MREVCPACGGKGIAYAYGVLPRSMYRKKQAASQAKKLLEVKTLQKFLLGSYQAGDKEKQEELYAQSDHFTFEIQEQDQALFAKPKRRFLFAKAKPNR
jgi:hypothetical protein